MEIYLILTRFVTLAAMLLTGCATNVPVVAPRPTPAPVVSPSPVPAPVPAGRIALSWENTTAAHPERIAWSDSLIKSLSSRFARLDNAVDTGKFCPNYSKLSKTQKLQVWGELFVGTAYYESSWNPGEYSVDVGTKDNKNTWSLGLLSLSVVDAANKNLGYSYGQLLEPEPNLDLGTEIMAQQIDRKGVVIASSSPYWSTLFNGKYSKISEIEAKVQKLSFCKSLQLKLKKK